MPNPIGDLTLDRHSLKRIVDDGAGDGTNRDDARRQPIIATSGSQVCHPFLPQSLTVRRWRQRVGRGGLDVAGFVDGSRAYGDGVAVPRQGKAMAVEG